MPPEAATDLFEAQRTRLLRLAYRMLGSRAAAEDVVQDAWLRWRQANLAEVRTPAAFLSRIVTRLCLDEMKSAHARRETYIGAWLPEPLLDTEQDPLGADDLTLTLMMALERLSPLERAAFLLHDVFGQPLDEVAAALDREAPAVRQLASRARKHVQSARPRFPVAREEGDRIARAFFTAAHTGDVVALKSMLAESVVIQADGGGKVTAFRNPIVGLARVLRLYAGLLRKFGGDWSRMIQPTWIDGLPGYISRERGGILQTTALEIEDGKIVAVYMTRNPDKLAQVLALVGDTGSRPQ
ncbi:sigma-70 family RNA polymerase sigma factor [Humitalea sp. 24SJ18S-53]|uniref:sigma-70 family RNA polymerase sigma factor n=1 Tax=Humitalea sp. 24SJ18S-53 TaxID=3422307 RepID=UPI003D673100